MQHEGAGLERGVALGAVEPHGQLAGQLEVMQGVAVAAGVFVIGLVAGAADAVEELGRARRQNATALQALEALVLVIPGIVGGRVGGQALGQQLAELAQLDQAGVGTSLK